MSDDYQNVYRYSRKTFKKSRKHEDNAGPLDNIGTTDTVETPRSEVKFDWCNVDGPSCSCDIPDQERDIASILHKKCPVISLAHEQLQRLLDGTDKLLSDHDRCCRTLCDVICIGREILRTQNKAVCALVLLIALAFMMGLLIGAASCGTYLGQFESPILSCIDNMFMADTFPIQETYRCIA